ncbi:MAG TPA: hypothetical protein VHR66_13450 [Gemmataceae bacterium]|jgi:hypothetical protein|nr:hypothetical protein [Gemmataceae bacterium]
MSDDEKPEPLHDERRPAYHDVRDDFDDEFGRSMTPREIVRRMVMVPAIAFIVIGVLGILGMCVAEAFLLFENLGRALNGRSQHWFNIILGTLGIAVAMTLFGMTIAGGVNMLQLRRRWLALFAAYVVASLSLAGCYAILFFPFGVWGLVLLYRPDVRREFPRAKKDQAEIDFDEPQRRSERE